MSAVSYSNSENCEELSKLESNNDKCLIDMDECRLCVEGKKNAQLGT